MTDERRLTSKDFPVHWPVLTRWADNDMFGHLNNAVYYELFDTAINGWISATVGFDPTTSPALAVVAESGCKYFSELAFPAPLVVGLGVKRLGRSSVTYRLSVSPQSDDGPLPIAAQGHWVHVYIDRVRRRPVAIPASIRELLTAALVD